MVCLEASKRVCSADLRCDVLELALVLGQLTELFVTVAHHLIQPADDVACERLHREWRGAIRVEAQEVRKKLLGRLGVLRKDCHHVCVGLAVPARVCGWVVQVIGPLEQQGPMVRPSVRTAYSIRGER
jgi:hypothetical protein